MNQQIIEKWQNNRIQNYLLTDEEYAELSQFIGHLEYRTVDANHEGEGWESDKYIAPKTSCLVYRLRPDYQPPKEPKIVKCEVEVDCFGRLVFTYKKERYLNDAINFPAFSHFEYDDGKTTFLARPSAQDDKPAEIPKYVVFVENDNA